MPDLICPHCHNPIYDEDALSCHFCGGSLKRGSGGALGKMQSAGMGWVWVTVAIVIAVAFLMSTL